MFQGYAIRLSIHAVEGNEMEDKAQYVVHSAFASSDLDKMCEVLSHVCEDADRRIEQEGGENWYAPSYMEHPDDHESIGEDEAPRLLPDEYAQITLVCGACHRQHFVNEHQWIRAEYLMTCESCGELLEPLSVVLFKAQQKQLKAEALAQVDSVKVEHVINLSGNARPGIVYMYPPEPLDALPSPRPLLYGQSPEYLAQVDEMMKLRLAMVQAKQIKLPPDPEAKNDTRAAQGAVAMKPYVADGLDDETGLLDLLTDLMHFADHFGVDFQEALRDAQVFYSQETDPNGPRF